MLCDAMHGTHPETLLLLPSNPCLDHPTPSLGPGLLEKACRFASTRRKSNAPDGQRVHRQRARPPSHLTITDNTGLTSHTSQQPAAETRSHPDRPKPKPGATQIGRHLLPPPAAAAARHLSSPPSTTQHSRMSEQLRHRDPAARAVVLRPPAPASSVRAALCLPQLTRFILLI